MTNTATAGHINKPSTTSDEPFVNGWFTLAVMNNGSHAVIRKIVRHAGNGKPVSREDILKKLKKEHICYGIDIAAIDALLVDVTAHKIPAGETVIASGDAEHGHNGALNWLIQDPQGQPCGLAVAAGTLVAERRPATKGKPGKNIYGKRINPRPGFDPQLEAGAGISIAPGKNGEINYHSKYAGILKYEHNTLSVDPGIRISADELQARMDIYGVTADGSTVPQDDIHAAITAAGIRYGLIKENITQALAQACQTRKHAGNVLIAAGKAPVHGRDAVINWYMELKDKSDVLRAVIPGQLIAEHTPEIHAEPGMNVLGETIPATPGMARPLSGGAGVDTVAVNGKTELRAKWLGTALWEDDVLIVTPDIEISEDKMSVSMGLYTRAAGPEHGDITSAHVVQTLKEHGVVTGINVNEIATALKKARTANRTRFRLQVAAGKPPRHGVSARLIIDDRLSTGKLLADGSIDYHERSYPWNVRTGDVIGRVTPVQAAQDGITVTGEVITAIPAETVKLVLDGVAEEAGGTLRVTADGILLVNGLNLRVSDSLAIDGDIDQHTGNIKVCTTVVVKGYVKPGYTVTTSGGDVVVQENVEDGQIQARGNIVVKAGVRGAKSKISASGNINTTFTENARLICSGNITVANNVISCNTWCKGNMSVGGSNSANSALLGGVTHIGKSLTVTNLGSEGCVKTLINLGPGASRIRRYKKITEDMEEKKQELDNLRKIFEHYQQEPGPNQELLLKKITATLSVKSGEYEKIRTCHAALHELMTRARQAHVVIRKNVFPGVVIQLLGQTYAVNEKRGAGTFHLSGEHLIFEPA